MNPVTITHKNPWTDLFTLLLITFISVFVISALIGGVGLMLFGHMDIVAGLASDSVRTRSFFYMLLGLSSVGTFLLPAWVFHCRNKQDGVFPRVDTADWKPYLLGLLFLFGMTPCMSLIADWNMNMTFPDAWRGLEQWMRSKEDEAAVLMESLIMVGSWERLLINILLLGVLPGIGEELFFRGALQHIAARIFKNEYTAIWVVAAIFSTIHFQFYGFFPRLLLGVFFGYMVVWSQNIWTAVLAHFVNNSMVVVFAFYYTRQGKDYVQLVESYSYTGIVYLGSLLASVMVAFLYYQYTKRKKIYGKGVD